MAIKLQSGSTFDATITETNTGNKTYYLPNDNSGLGIVSGTAVPYTSFTTTTYHDFTGIPSWVKRITIPFSGISLSGTDDLAIQLGDSGGIETTGYSSQASVLYAGPSALVASETTAFSIKLGASASDVFTGVFVLTLADSATNLWIGSYVGGVSGTTRTSQGGGSKALSGTLTQLRVKSGGSNTFDAGTINILYE
jgi:hypothetical protein